MSIITCLNGKNHEWRFLELGNNTVRECIDCSLQEILFNDKWVDFYGDLMEQIIDQIVVNTKEELI